MDIAALRPGPTEAPLRRDRRSTILPSGKPEPGSRTQRTRRSAFAHSECAVATVIAQELDLPPSAEIGRSGSEGGRAPARPLLPAQSGAAARRPPGQRRDSNTRFSWECSPAGAPLRRDRCGNWSRPKVAPTVQSTAHGRWATSRRHGWLATKPAREPSPSPESRVPTTDNPNSFPG